MIKENIALKDLQTTKEEFLEKNKNIIKEYAIPIDENNMYISGIVGNINDCKKLDFNGVYIFIENNKVFYIGVTAPGDRTIKARLQEHKSGHPSHSNIIPYLMSTRNLDKKQAKDLLKTFEFIAFKYKSFEYELINNTPGLINKSGNHNKKKSLTALFYLYLFSNFLCFLR